MHQSFIILFRVQAISKIKKDLLTTLLNKTALKHLTKHEGKNKTWKKWDTVFKTFIRETLNEF